MRYVGRTLLLWSPAILVATAFATLDAPVNEWRTWAAFLACMVANKIARDTGQVR